MHGSQKCCDKHTELTVDDILQITDAGDQELQRLEHSIWRGTMELGAEDNDELLHKLVLHSLRNNQPMQVIIHQPMSCLLATIYRNY